MNDVITFSLPRPLVLGLGALLILLVLSALVYITLPKDERDTNPLTQLRDHLGLQTMPLIVFIVVLALWTGLAITLTLGLFGLISEIIYNAQPDTYLFYVLRIAGLTTVLGAVIALPFTVIRLRLTHEQTATAKESLFNEKINTATQGLYARRQVTKAVAPGGSYKLHQNFWEDDIVQRNAAIDRLEGLAEENPSEVPRIARILSLYVREISAQSPAHLPPPGFDLSDLQDWISALPNPRSDLEKAAQMLGQLAHHAVKPLSSYEIDLKGANLQRCTLDDTVFTDGNFTGAQMHGATLRNARLQGSRLFNTSLQDADLSGARLQGAEMSNVKLQGARLVRTKLNGANLEKAQLEYAILEDAQLRGAHLKGAILRNSSLKKKRSYKVRTSLRQTLTTPFVPAQVSLEQFCTERLLQERI